MQFIIIFFFLALMISFYKCLFIHATTYIHWWAVFASSVELLPVNSSGNWCTFKHIHFNYNIPFIGLWFFLQTVNWCFLAPLLVNTNCNEHIHSPILNLKSILAIIILCHKRLVIVDTPGGG